MGSVGARLAFNSGWNSGPGIDGIFSDWVGEIFENAPYEALLFRAFSIPQMYLRLPGRSVLILRNFFFATCHIGTRVFKAHLEGVELFVSLLKVFASGLAFAWCSLRTLDPFVASAFHALLNVPQPIYYPGRDLAPYSRCSSAMSLARPKRKRRVDRTSWHPYETGPRPSRRPLQAVEFIDNLKR